MLYLTLRGIPLNIELEWPVRPSHSGSDWFVLHGRATVEDGSGLHADFSVNMSRSVVQALPSLEPKDARSVAINAVRKAADTRDIEFLKSGKRQPIQCSSRVHSIVTGKWTFNDIHDQQLREFIERKVYWDSVATGDAAKKSWIGDPVEAQYLNSSSDRLVAAAEQLAKEGLVDVSGDIAAATVKLRARAEQYQSAVKHALEDLEAKHAFERA